ncbi:MAG: sugar transferase [Solirubrobacteraceae bacterium]
MKRAFDIVAATALLLLLSPLLLIAAIVVGLDSPGPALFRQRRLGQDREPFEMLKFRSMYRDVSPDVHRAYIAQLAQEGYAGNPGELHKLTGDERVTRSGRLLRRTSLDELPQLLNVLLGDMSLVGPRPAVEYELEHYRPPDYDRFLVRPGMTGLWQVSGRARLGLREMLVLDLEYAHHWSLRLDAKILLGTPAAVIGNRTA